MGNAVAQLSTDNEQKKFVTPFLAGNLEESNSYILKFYEIKKQKLEQDTKFEKTNSRGKAPNSSKGKATATVCLNPKPGTQCTIQNTCKYQYQEILVVWMSILLCVVIAINGNQENVYGSCVNWSQYDVCGN